MTIEIALILPVECLELSSFFLEQEKRVTKTNKNKMEALFILESLNRLQIYSSFFNYPFIFKPIPGFKSSPVMLFHFCKSETVTPGYFFEMLNKESPFCTK